MLRKKIYKISSVLVAVIIAFSCFLLPCSAAYVPIVGDVKLGNLSLFAFQFSFTSGGKQYYVNDVSPVGVLGDGSLRMHYNIADSNEAPATLPSGSQIIVEVNWKGEEYPFYISFPDTWLPLTSFTSSSNFEIVSDGLIKFTSNRTGTSRPYFKFVFTSSVAFSQFNIDFSLEDTNEVPPMEALINDLGGFFGNSVSWFSNIFNIISANSALFFVIVGFPLVAFVFAIPKFLKG